MTKKETVLPEAGAPLSPRAIAYQREMDARRASPKVGGKTPPIPKLDEEAVHGVPMATQAEAQRAQRAPMPSIIQQGVPLPAGGPGSDIPLVPSDLLPPVATKDPTYMGGMGANYAINQPHLAAKYGVIRKGKHIPPQMLRQGGAVGQGGEEWVGGLRKSTVEQLEALAEAQRKPDTAESDQEDIVAENAARAGVSGPAIKAVEEEVQKGSKLIDQFDFDTFRQLVTRDILNDPEQKKIIEDRVEPLDLGDLIVQGFVIQTVPIVPGVFEVEFQSTTGQEQVEIKRLLTLESKRLDSPEEYLLEKHAIMSITVGLRSIMKKPLPSHTTKDGKFDEAAFWKKFEFVAGLNNHMLSSLGINFFWFDQRVRKLFVVEKVKNG